MLRTYISKWRAYRAAAEAEALAYWVGPHIARDIGLLYPSQRPAPVCFNPAW